MMSCFRLKTLLFVLPVICIFINQTDAGEYNAWLSCTDDKQCSFYEGVCGEVIGVSARYKEKARTHYFEHEAPYIDCEEAGPHSINIEEYVAACIDSRCEAVRISGQDEGQ
jgi:hypothetical protein